MGNINENSEDKKEIINRFGNVKVKCLYAAKFGTEKVKHNQKTRRKCKPEEGLIFKTQKWLTKLTRTDKVTQQYKEEKI